MADTSLVKCMKCGKMTKIPKGELVCDACKKKAK
jgi:hypothetical protein